MCRSSSISYHMLSIVMPLSQDCSKSKLRCIRVQIEFLAEIDPCHYWCIDQCLLDKIKGLLVSVFPNKLLPFSLQHVQWRRDLRESRNEPFVELYKSHESSKGHLVCWCREFLHNFCLFW